MRHHVVSLVAVFLGLAVGIVLGSGLLADSVVSGLRDDKAELRREIQEAEDHGSRLEAQLLAADGFDSTIGPRIVRDELLDRTVLLVTTPDAAPEDVDAVVRSVGDALTDTKVQLLLTLVVLADGIQHTARFYDDGKQGEKALIVAGEADTPQYHRTGGWRVGTLVMTCEGTRIQDAHGNETPLILDGNSFRAVIP